MTNSQFTWRDTWHIDQWWVMTSLLTLSLAVALEAPGLAIFSFSISVCLSLYRILNPDGQPAKVDGPH